MTSAHQMTLAHLTTPVRQMMLDHRMSLDRRMVPVHQMEPVRRVTAAAVLRNENFPSTKESFDALQRLKPLDSWDTSV